jgi:hypothetical protein
MTGIVPFLSFRWRVAILVGVVAMATAPLARGLERIRVLTDPASGIEIEAIHPKFFPMGGYCPIRLRVSNHSGAERVWRIESITTNENPFRNMADRQTWAATFRVPHQGEGEFRFYVPVITLDGSYWGSELQVVLRGPGMMHESRFVLNHSGPYGNRCETVLVSESFRSGYGQPLEDAVKDDSGKHNSREVRMESLAPDDFDPDYRGYSGYRFLFLTADDWSRLKAQQRLAIKQWVGFGNRLWIAMPDSAEIAALSELPKGADKDAVSYGFGEIRRYTLEAASTQLIHFCESPESETRISFPSCGTGGQNGLFGAGQWSLRNALGERGIPTIWLLIFVVIFASLLGPVNFYLAARRKRHAQILWTTPLFSLIAGIVLACVIVFSDGFGGTGHRMAVVMTYPADLSMLTVQEQVARCGILFSRTFPFPSIQTMLRLVVEEDNRPNSGSYHLESERMSGDWFRGGTFTGQRLLRAESSRSRIEVTHDGTNPPVMHSSLPVPLKKVFYCDASNNLWRLENLGVGERRAMRETTAEEFGAWIKGLMTSRYFESGLSRMRAQSSYYFAEGDAGNGAMIETIPAIHWNGDILLLCGPVASGEAEPAGGAK